MNLNNWNSSPYWDDNYSNGDGETVGGRTTITPSTTPTSTLRSRTAISASKGNTLLGAIKTNTGKPVSEVRVTTPPRTVSKPTRVGTGAFMARINALPTPVIMPMASTGGGGGGGGSEESAQAQESSSSQSQGMSTTTKLAIAGGIGVVLWYFLK